MTDNTQNNPPPNDSDDSSDSGAAFSQDELNKLSGQTDAEEINDDESSDEHSAGGMSSDELSKLLGEVDEGKFDDNTASAPSDPPTLDQSELDSLISGSTEPEAFEMDDVPIDGSDNDDVPLDNTQLDDVIGNVEKDVVNLDDVDDIDVPDLATEAHTASATPDIGSENVAAGAAPDTEEPLDQDLIDSLISDANGEESPAEEVEVVEDDADIALGGEGWNNPAPPEDTPDPSDAEQEAEEEKEPFTFPSISISFPGIGESLPKIAASLLFGIACGLVTFSWLVLNQDRIVTAENDGAGGEEIIRRAVASVEGLVEDGLYDRAALEIEAALTAAPNASNRADADYWKIKTDYLQLEQDPAASDAEALLADMGKFAEEAASHPRVTEVLRWRGDVYGRTGIPLAELGVYNDLLTNYVAPLDGDHILLAAGRAALELNRPQQAADYLRRLRQEYPASDLADEAGLYQGDAYHELGSRAKAELVYRQIAVSNPAARIGGEAYARLAQLSFDDGAYDESIELLETRLATATTTDGNEEAYLLLARSLRATGQHEEAERVLRELTQFFPENPRTAEALVELSQVMEARGRRPEASNIARQAAQRFPKNSQALENAAVFLAQAGDERGAAESLLEAEAVGAEKPALLLDAARHYAETGETKAAQRTYERLLDSYDNSPEAFDGRIELATIYFDQGKVQKSIDWLEDLAAVNANGPRAVPVLLALSHQYSTLGLNDRAAAAQKQIAAIAGEQEVLASAAAALLEGSDVEAGLAVAHQVDVNRLQDPLAYRFLRAHGVALRTVDGRRALAQLERAYHNYPNERKPNDALDLLQSYLAADQTGTARALVMDLNGLSKSDITTAPALTKAAVMWGDHLFQRRDFRAAAEAYSLVESAVTEEGNPLTAWARLQHANAMLQLRDVTDSVPLLQEVSKSGSAWSNDASLRQSYAEVERRLAHEEPIKPNGD